jgi:hypothetical protein
MPTQPLLADAIPQLAHELEGLLAEQGEPELAAQVRELRIMDRCRCGDDFCATFYTQPKSERMHGPRRSCIEVTPKQGMLILDILDGKISGVEVLFRDEFRQQLDVILP